VCGQVRHTDTMPTHSPIHNQSALSPPLSPSPSPSPSPSLSVLLCSFSEPTPHPPSVCVFLTAAVLRAAEGCAALHFLGRGISVEHCEGVCSIENPGSLPRTILSAANLHPTTKPRTPELPAFSCAGETNRR
jgi:hypothetical protein